MAAPRRIIVFRFSAMGDVAMTAPVLSEFQKQYPETELIMVSRPLFAPFFKAIPGIRFHAIEPKGKHQGLKGLFTLYKELQAYQPEAIADLHNNLRSRILSTLFRFKGLNIVHVDKARGEKKSLTRKENKILRPLKRMTERYADVFRALGFPMKLTHQLSHQAATLDEKVLQISGGPKNNKWIGISPFAQHAQKVYPLNKMENVVQHLAQENYTIFIFGGGAVEQEIANTWAKHANNIISTIGKLKLEEELNLISHLDLMLSMDSAGMHMASLMGVPVVSVWGATHPHAGFLGYGQDVQNCVQIDLSCRPCSVYGNKPCFRGDFACMNRLSEEIILQKIKDTIQE